MWVCVPATSQVSRPPTGTGGMHLVASQVSIQPSTFNLTTGTCPDSLGCVCTAEATHLHCMSCVCTACHVLTLPTMHQHHQPHIDTTYHALTPPTMHQHHLPCINTTYHTSTPPTTHQHHLPRINTTYHAFTLPPMCSSCPGTLDGGLTMGRHAAQPSSPAL